MPIAHRASARVAVLGVGIPPVELGVDQWPDVDTVDGQVDDFIVYVGVGRLGAAHHGTAHVNAAEPVPVRSQARKSEPLRPVRSNREPHRSSRKKSAMTRP
jgi:hypothetical protein